MALMDRKKLLAKEELEVVKVDLGDGEHVFVRQMTGRERDRFEQSILKVVRDSRGMMVAYEQNLDDFRAKLAVNTLCDEKGNNLLKPEDIGTLSQNMSAKRLELIVNVAQRLNRITDEDKEELLKN